MPAKLTFEDWVKRAQAAQREPHRGVHASPWMDQGATAGRHSQHLGVRVLPRRGGQVPPVEKLPPLTEELKRDRWHSAMRKHSEKTEEPFDRRSQGH